MVTRERIRQRLLIEELVRKRRTDDAERFVEVFRRSTIDPNPHQIEAAMFALRRLSEGGALLCDEVGLGKTIEAGLVITQLRAQGKTHALIIVPLTLARQWQVELQDLFSLTSTIVGPDSPPERGARGIYIIGRELASTQKGRSILSAKAPYDLVVIDEAHEMFANIYARFSKNTGDYMADLSKGASRRAAQVKEMIEGVPLLLLTATPLQNSMYELWGLIHYIDPGHKVLGRFNEYCSLFVEGGEGGRAISQGMEETLRRRLAMVLKRTLRHQAQPFMKQPFRKRQVLTANFHPQRMECELYEAISLWLARETIAAYRRGHRSLMALQVRRRMASSIEALVSTLGTIKERMHKMKHTGVYPGRESYDLELDSDYPEEDNAEPIDMAMLEQDLGELSRIEHLAKQVLKAGADAKKEKLHEIIRQVQSRSMQGVASDKVVVFTESVKTMNSLADFLESNGFAGQVTVFSGSNDGPIAQRALAAWQEDVGRYIQGKLDQTAALRGALVHEFKTRTSVLIATEAGAKGLNLQFCNCLVNYDLPWNPQRIEQRIGRIHRYGQEHDVVVINFINLSNEAEKRVYELLEQKLKVFSETLGASDTVLNTPELVLNLETRINEMLDRCRTPEDIQLEFDRLNLELDAAQSQMRDRKLLSVRQLTAELDSSVQARLGQLEGDIGIALSRCDETLLDILKGDGKIEQLEPAPPRILFKWNGRLCHLGPPKPSAEFGEPVHRDHNDVEALISGCIAETDGQNLEVEADAAGSLKVYRLKLIGIEEEERILITGDSPGLLSALKLDGLASYAGDLEQGIAEIKEEAEQRQRDYVTRLINQLSARREDLRLCCDRTIAQLQKKLEAAERAFILAASPEALAKARTQKKRILAEIEKSKNESAHSTQEQLLKLEEEEQAVRLLQFVEVVPQLLFTITASSSGRN